MSPRSRCFYPFERHRNLQLQPRIFSDQIFSIGAVARPPRFGALSTVPWRAMRRSPSLHTHRQRSRQLSPFWKERKSHSKAVRTVVDPEADIAPRLIDAGDPFRPKGGYTSPHAPHCANPKFLIWSIAKPDSLVLDIGRRQWDGVTSVGRFWRQSRALF